MPHDPIERTVGQGRGARGPARILGGPSSPAFVSREAEPGSLALIRGGEPLPVICAPGEPAPVRRAAADLCADLGRVCGKDAELLAFPPSAGWPAAGSGAAARRGALILGTISSQPLFSRLASEGKLDLSELVAGPGGRASPPREAFVIAPVDEPRPGSPAALAIVGSDARGAVYGAYELCAAAGVSPWRWWADVPPRRSPDLYALPGTSLRREPAVRYRGIFLNDEEPCLGSWARRTFGGFNAAFYSRVFELVLRLGGNFVWPAMWGKAFDDDDPANAAAAEAFGVVVGTSHHEPMGRAHVEWARRGSGPWSFARNPDALREFWRAGVARMRGRERVVTVGMRGDGDEPMEEGSDETLLRAIVDEQRRIIAEETGAPSAETPQAWAVYKEVQELYDRGYRPPDDVTIVLGDDNWGNLRRLPGPADAARPGGFGVYYHLDYVGGPRSYKWIDTSQASRVWEQMDLARERGADRLWIVNVGDLKPLERQVEFFLALAREPGAWKAGDAAAHAAAWASGLFGPALGPRIGGLLARQELLAARRKPELLEPSTYSLTDYGEAERALAEHAALEAEALRIEAALPREARDAFYQLALYPVAALANLLALHDAVGRNRLYASQGRASANAWAAKAEAYFARDAGLSGRYNRSVAAGKWEGMMVQTHIGYSGWNQPETNAMPATVRVAPLPGPAAGMAVEGSARSWPAPPAQGGTAGAAADAGATDAAAPPLLPELDSRLPGGSWIELFRRGDEAFSFEARSEAPWLLFDPPSGIVDADRRIRVDADWDALPEGAHEAVAMISGPEGLRLEARVRAYKAPPPPAGWEDAFAEVRAAVAVEAEHRHAAIDGAGAAWEVIPGLGRTLSGVRAFPASAGPFEAAASRPRLEYRILLRGSGPARVTAFHSPSLDSAGRGRLAYAVSLDDGEPVLVDARADRSPEAWERSVADNVLASTAILAAAPGPHLLKYWAVDPELVLQRLVLCFGDLPYSYLGPPESPRAGARGERNAI